MPIIFYDGIPYNADEQIIQAANHLLENQLGLIETILFKNGQMPLWKGHCERMQRSFEALGWRRSFDFFERLKAVIEEQAGYTAAILKIRIRLFSQNSQLHYLFEMLQPPPERRILKIGIAKQLVIQPNKLSWLKSNSRKVYEEALKQARGLSLQDMLLLNQAGRIVESSIANIFWKNDGRIFSPPLSEGCVAGVYRASLLNGNISFENKPVQEKCLTVQEAIEADEIFLTNAVRGIQKVDQLVL